MGGHVRGQDPAEQADAELARLRRLASVDRLLTALIGVADLREVGARRGCVFLFASMTASSQSST
jgi:hypothetical protein